MKLRYLILILFFFIFNLSHSQELSEISKLKITAKIWGFLKYYHPEVASGKLDWDKELMFVLSKVREAKDKESLSKIYMDWIKSIGLVNKCKNCKYESKDVFNKNFDLSWIADEKLIDISLSDTLKNIEENRFQGKNFYVVPAEVGNVVITNEKSYNDIDYPQVEYRLLGLFRYWNIIEYFYPYKYLLDKKWDDVLEQMIPKYINAQNKSEYRLAIKELVGSVDDSHTWIHFEDYSNLKYFPYLIKNIDNSCVISGFYNDEIAEKEGLQMGDIITEIGGKNLQEELYKNMKYISASNLNRKICNTYLTMLNSPTENNVELVIKRQDRTFKKTVNLYRFYEELKYYDSNLNKTWEVFDEGRIGYVRMRLLSKDRREVSKMMKIMLTTKAFIIDLRGYPRTSFYALSDYLNSEKRAFATIVNPDLSYPGKFVYGNTLTTGHKNKNYYKGKVLILVDEQSLSLSEFAVMCLQTADNAVTVGSQTAASDGSVSSFDYLGGFETTISGKGVYYPDGSETQRVGVKIDYIAVPTLLGLSEGRDEVFDKAIDIAKDFINTGF